MYGVMWVGIFATCNLWRDSNSELQEDIATRFWYPTAEQGKASTFEQAFPPFNDLFRMSIELKMLDKQKTNMERQDSVISILSAGIDLCR